MKASIHNQLCRSLEHNIGRVNIHIYRLLDARWSLEVETSNGQRHVWESLFGSASEAARIATSALRKTSTTDVGLFIVDS